MTIFLKIKVWYFIDEDNVQQSKENPYLQYFLGFSSYSNEPQFEASMLVHFRERITLELINKVNRLWVKEREQLVCVGQCQRAGGDC